MAEQYLSRSLQIAQETCTKLHAKDVCKAFCEMYEAQSHYEQALAYYKEYSSLKDEIFNAERSKQIANMRTRYETEQKEKEAEIYRLRNVELRREIGKRKKAEKELKQYRDQLENLVAERTAKLNDTNIELKQEIAERRRVEKELLGYQRQLRSLAHELSLVEEKQRRKIATNLHDNISQSLMIIKSSLDRLVTARSVKQVRHKLKEIQSYIMDIIQRTRSMTFEISPPVLYELGLEPAVEWLAERFQEQHGIACEFQDDGKPKPINEDWRCILFQSTRELLVNTRKHANASKVVISTCKDGRHVKITVKDNGVGFDPSILDEKIAKNEGFGLFNLRQRLTHLRGKIEIASEEGQGTKITISAPITPNRRTTRIQT
jgi:signal transduction histidine kinase